MYGVSIVVAPEESLADDSSSVVAPPLTAAMDVKADHAQVPQ